MRKLWSSIIAIVLVVLLISPTSSEAAKFKDVGNSHSLQVEIEYLVDQGIINGYADGTFKPNAAISKKHVAAMIVKALNLPTDNVKNPGYKDVPESHAYYKEIAAAYTAGIFGDAANFKPESNISRAFMAQILTKAFKLKVNGASNSFTDVKKSNAFYVPIQAIATNNISKGSRDKKYNLKFEPNKTLTRAHFSAFLARAMTLKKDGYMPNTNFDYYFTYSTGFNTIYVNKYDADYYGENYWVEYDSTTNEELNHSVYGTNGNMWFEGAPYSDVGIFLDYPFTIGLKYNYLNDPEVPDGKQTITSTSATVSVQGFTYKDVIIVEEQFYAYYDTKPKQLSFSRTYIAPDYGIIKTETGVVGKKATWTRELVKRVSKTAK